MRGKRGDGGLEQIASKEDYKKWLEMDLRASKMIERGGQQRKLA